jgi:hypothetical protein
MGALHWLIVVPYYFIGALAALPLLMVTCRLVRAKASLNALVGTAIGVTVAAIVVPLVCGWLHLSAFTGRPLLLLLIASLLLAALDTALAGRLPLPLDTELRDL